MSAIINQSGNIRQLDKQGEPPERITPEQWQDVPRMTRLMTDILRQLAILLRRFWPLRIDYEDRVVDGTGVTQYRFAHGFGGRVRWWVVDWQGAQPFDLARISTTDNNTLVLVSRVSGIVTIRVEEAG